ncbi:MAG TPA: GtrA family protein [Mycobacteriales bacterium]|nr:GtrA family protein [Mycobacteriales bacterium]
MFRYTAGSAVAFAVSELCFVALFGPHLLGAKGASIVASIVGVIPGYFLNRNWAWGRRGRSHPWREVMPYWLTVIVSTALAAIAIGAVNHAASALGRDVRTVINAATYCAVYGTLFIAKFRIFNSWLFRDTPRSDPDREDQSQNQNEKENLAHTTR